MNNIIHIIQHTARAATVLLLALLTATTAWADSTFSGGDGSQGNPYKIANETDLRQLATDVNGGNSYSGKFFQQSQNITLTQNFTSIGCYKSNSQGGSKSFSGTYDGGNKTISGLTINGSTTMQGLFGRVENATIQNLTLSGASVTNSASYVGAFVGYSNGGLTMTNCHAVNCNVSAPNKESVAIFVGRLYNPASTIKSCTVSGGSVSGSSHVGAIVGYAYATSAIHAIVGCVARGVTGGDNLIGTNTSSCVSNVASYGNNDYTITAGTGVTITYSAISNTYSDIIHPPYIKAGETVPVTLSYTGSLSNVTYQATGATLNDEGTQLSNAQGNVTITATEAPKTDISGGSIADIAWQTWTGSALTPALTVTVGGKTLTAATDYLVNYTDNTHIGTATATVTGTGAYNGTLTKTFEIRHSDMPYNSTGNFYEIGNETALRALSSYVGSGGETSGRTFKQTEDITLTSSFSPIGISNYYQFHGIYDGNNKTISGLSVSGNVKYAALFGYMQLGTVKNVILISPSVSSSYKNNSYGARVSALVGYMNTDAIIDNCIVINPTLSATGQGNNYVGIFIGESGSRCSISNCYYYDGNTEHNYATHEYDNYISATNILRVYSVNATGCTATATPTISVSGTDYYKEGTAVTVTAGVPSSGIKKFTVTGATASLTETLGQYTLTMPANDVTVSLEDVTPTITLADMDLTYTGTAIEPAVTVKDGETTLTANTDYTVAYSSNTNAGEGAVTITGCGVYLGTTTKAFTIAKATPTITAPAAVTNLIYNGSAQELVTTGTTTFGTMTYSLDGTNYSTDIPTGTAAGTYTVYYKVEGSDNWNAVDAQTVSVTITTRTYTVTFDANGGSGTMEPMQLTYGGEWTALTANTFTRSGYGFNGWNTKADGSGTAYSDEGWVKNLTTETSIVLYAQWGKDIATCTATVPDQTMGGYSYIFYKFESANSNAELAAAMGVVVKDGDVVLTLGTDYEFGNVKFADGSDGMPASIGDECLLEIKGKGNYAGSLWAPFTITVADASGSWGELAWAFHAGTLTISGTGAMNAASDYSGYPWFSVASNVKTITIGEGVTTIADAAFAGTSQINYYSHVATASLPTTLTAIGDDAFAYCNGLTIAIPSGVTISSSAFYQVGCVVGTLSNAADNTDIIGIMAAAQSADVQLQGRTLYKDGSWNTLCLPFAVSTASGTLSGDNVQAMTLNTTTSNLTDGTLTLNFTAAETIPAGTPFIIKWDESGTDITNPVFEGVTISNATNDATIEDVLTFTGTYAPVSIPADGDNTKLYLGAANKLYYPNAAMTIGCQRAYFQLADGITAGKPAGTDGSGEDVRAFVLNFDDDEATGIITKNFTNSTNSSNEWYSLDGVKLAAKPTAKGLYIHGGKKVAIK